MLPKNGSSPIRLSLEFAPTRPAPVADAALSPESYPRTSDSERLLSEYSPNLLQGSYPVSPALDFVKIAERLVRLDELRGLVTGIATGNDRLRKSRLSLLAMIDISREDFSSANSQLDLLFRLVEQEQHADYESCSPETLALHLAMSAPETRPAARELVTTLYERHVRGGQSSGFVAWDQFIAATLGQLRFAQNVKNSRDDVQIELRRWKPGSSETAKTRLCSSRVAHNIKAC